MEYFILFYVVLLAGIHGGFAWNIYVWATGGDQYITTMCRENPTTAMLIIMLHMLQTLNMVFHIFRPFDL